jgi:hypothetical protein
MASFNVPAPPPPPSGNPVDVIVEAANDAADGAGDVVDAVIDATQDPGANGGPKTPAAPNSLPIPYPNVAGLGAAVDGFAGFARQVANEVGGTVETDVGAAAGIVSEVLSRALPVVIGVLGGMANAGGASRKVSQKISVVAAKVDRVVGVLTGRRDPAGGDDHRSAMDAAGNLRELGHALNRDIDWQRANLRHVTLQLSGKQRTRPHKSPGRGPGGATGDAKHAYRMLARLTAFEGKLGRLETILLTRGRGFADEARAIGQLRASLRIVLRAGADADLRKGRAVG